MKEAGISVMLSRKTAVSMSDAAFRCYPSPHHQQQLHANSSA